MTLKFLQSSIVLTLSDNGINSTSDVNPLLLLGDILALKHPNVDSMMSEVMLCTSSPFRRASSLLKYAMSMSASLLTLSPLVRNQGDWSLSHTFLSELFQSIV